MSVGSHNRVEVLHGANLNMLGSRDELFYGNLTLSELEREIGRYAKELGISVSFFQTNSEADYIERLHRLGDVADAAVLNAGAWTHYSWAIRDALEVAGVPAVEVHISDVHSREEWRRQSVFDGLVLSAISGKGQEGYREALELLAGELSA